MIPCKRIPLLCALLLTFSATGLAQKSFCTAPPPSPFHHSALIVTSFDSGSGRMKTTLEHPHSLGDGIYMRAAFFYQDRRLRTPPTIDIFFVTASKKPRYGDMHELSILADGRALPSVGAEQYFTEHGERKLTVEKMRLTLTYASLATLIKARRVTVRLGSTEVELSNNHLESLREIASLMAPPSNTARR
jgi:hypothetical protein